MKQLATVLDLSLKASCVAEQLCIYRGSYYSSVCRNPPHSAQSPKE